MPKTIKSKITPISVSFYFTNTSEINLITPEINIEAATLIRTDKYSYILYIMEMLHSVRIEFYLS